MEQDWLFWFLRVVWVVAIMAWYYRFREKGWIKKPSVMIEAVIRVVVCALILVLLWFVVYILPAASSKSQ